jgi:mannose-6-phosphate isomerase-like protein (cupin superfamily)
MKALSVIPGASFARCTMRISEKATQVVAGNDRFGKPLLFDGGYFQCKVSAKDTGGALCIYETVRTKKGGPFLHCHQSQDEWFFVRKGKFLFQIGDDRFQLGDGDSVFAPRKVPHTFANVSDDGILMIVYQPAGTMEQFFLDGSRLLSTNPSPHEWQALCQLHGVENVGPRLTVD